MKIVATQAHAHGYQNFGHDTFALALEVSGEKVACAVFSCDEDLIYLEDLFVLPFHEGQGFTRSFLTQLAKTASQNLVGQLQWSRTNFVDSVGAIPTANPNRLSSNQISA